jgi:nicotinamide mononucleotide adenylyltransferase
MERHDMISRAIADNGLPLKIQTQWTEDVYTNQEIDGNIETIDVKGWLIKINGKKYPRQLGEDGIDWTYRYTAPNTEQGRQTAIKRALQEARLTIW